jgi:Fe-S-cluster-containing hydrogenase component 2/thioredoxin reductase/CRP-like cAMP-binding protein
MNGEPRLGHPHASYRIVIVGSGPAGLSAAARAAEIDAAERPGQPPSHLLLEAFEAHARTIQRYQKGKFVMAEPGFLDLRSPLRFRAGAREAVLAAWAQGIESLGINVRYRAEVAAIRGQRGAFAITLKDGSTVSAEHVVLAIGLEGQPNRIGAPGEDSGLVHYQLDDPDAWRRETIIVIGAGDSAIENALGLSRNNAVHIVNRREEFSRAKEGNLNAVLRAINDRSLDFHCHYRATVERIEPAGADGLGAIVLNTPEGQRRIACHKVLARLGGTPPRTFLEACGMAFPSARPDALPTLDAQCQSSVPGLYVIGSLAGFPLIKQAMNQGQDVVDSILGRAVRPVDHVLLALQFAGLPYVAEVEEILALYQQRVPMFRRMNALAFRELLIESRLIVSFGDADSVRSARAQVEKGVAARRAEQRARREAQLEQMRRAGERPADSDLADPPEPRATEVLEADSALFRTGDYSNGFYTVLEGEVRLRHSGSSSELILKPGQFFGEMSLISGRPRSGDAFIGADTILIETPRRTMVKLLNSNDEVRAGVDWIFIVRALQGQFAPALPVAELRAIAQAAKVRSFAAGESLYSEGETGDCLHLVRSGTIALTRGGALVGHAQSGQLCGQMALMGDPLRRETARASVRTETIQLGRAEFLELLKKDPQRVGALQAATSQQLRNFSVLEALPEGGELVSFLMAEGLGEATNALLIDESLCVGCDNCEKACAETHGGLSRLDRHRGRSHAAVQVPISCRHCEHPHCMKDCPTDSIHRAIGGEVFIDDRCIGCGNCQTHCPYGVIRMEYAAPKKPGLLSWLLFATGHGPGEDTGAAPDKTAKAAGRKAVKCDACQGLDGGPACVRACPTGAAVRTSPEGFAALVEKRLHG